MFPSEIRLFNGRFPRYKQLLRLVSLSRLTMVHSIKVLEPYHLTEFLESFLPLKLVTYRLPTLARLILNHLRVPGVLNQGLIVGLWEISCLSLIYLRNK